MLFLICIYYSFKTIQLEDFGGGKAQAGSILAVNNDVVVQEWKLLKHIMDSVHFGTIVFDRSSGSGYDKSNFAGTTHAIYDNHI